MTLLAILVAMIGTAFYVMLRKDASKTLVITILASALAIPAIAAQKHEIDANGTPVVRGAKVHQLLHHDLSKPLREMVPTAVQFGVKRVVPNRPIHIDRDTNAPVVDNPYDPTMQMSFGLTNAPATGSSNFLGIGNGFTGPQGTWTVNVAPPDTVMDVGPNHIVQSVNSGFVIFSKTGTTAGSAVYGPVNLNTLWSGFGGGCQTNNDGDPTINYDQMANRWMIAQFSVSTTPYTECVAISQTSDPTGAWYRFSYSFGTTNFNDYPHVGVWPDGYYITYNIFGSTSFGEVCAHDRSKMILGQANTMQCFTTGSNVQGLLASDMDGTTQPPAGAPNYVLRFGSNQLQMWKFHVDWTTPGNSTFTGPTNLAVAAFTPSCSTSTRGACIPQANGSTSYYLESLADRLMNRVAYRNFGGYEAMTVAHSIGAQTAANVRWYELRNMNSTPTVYQSGTFSPDTSWRWVASTAMDQQGNMAMGYSVSSSSISPTIRVTGRLAGDALGTMGTETDILGSVAHASQIGTYGSPAKPLQRWGDYSAMVVDPSDDCTFWYTTEYIPTQGIFNWATRVANFKFPSCGGVADTTAPTTSLTAPAAGTVSGTVTVSANASDNVGVTNVEFYRSGTLIGSDSSSPYSISWDTTGTTNGNYTLTSKAYDAAGNNASSAGVAVTVNNVAPPGGIVNGTFETGSLSGWTSAGTTGVLTGTVHGGTYADRNGTTTATNGDSNIVQTFTVPAGGGTVSFWYKMTCPDTVTYDWVTATLVDNTTAVTTTLLPKTCATNAVWVQVTSGTLVAGHSVTLTLTSHDDNYASDPSYTYFDDVVFNGTVADTTAPTTSITAPANGATVANTITVSANASDNVGVTNVEFYRGTTLISSDATSPYSISWNTTTVANGSYTLTSKAYDAAGNIGTSAGVTVTVSNDTTAPTTSITAPASGATVSGSAVAVSANASDNVGVTNVEFYRGTTLISNDNTSPYSISWNTTTVANGSYTLTSKAYDAAGNVGTSAGVTVTVSNGGGALDLSAAYSATLKAPACGSNGKSCDTGATLINGRGTMTSGIESNAPNTINNSCADGNSGTYHSDESIDRMKIATNDSTAFAGGKAVTVTFTTYCYSSADKLDVYYTSNTTTPSWTLVGTQACTAAGVKTFTATYTLPAGSAGSTQAVRGTFRYNGSVSACGTNSGYDDHDDLVFTMN